MKSLNLAMLLLSASALAQTLPASTNTPAGGVSDNISKQPTSIEKTPLAKEAPIQVFKKNAVIMLALNYSKGEIEAVKSAAEARGQDFILLPEMSDVSETIAKRAYEAEVFEHRILYPLIERAAQANGKEKSVLDKKVNALKIVNTANFNKVPEHKRAKIEEVLLQKVDELQKAGVGVDTLIISAHDGGGYFSGTLGSTSVTKIAQLTKVNTSFKNSLRSVFMMGCYTATTEQARLWKTDFPKIELVAGYDQSAPLRDAPKGWSYIHDVIVLQKSLTDVKDKDEMNAVANRITDINKSSSAFAVFPACENCTVKKEFYRGKITNYKVDEFDLKFCEQARPEFEKNFELYREYADGKKTIPNDTSHSLLRDLYSFYRTHEVCYGLDAALGPPANEVFFLLFHHNVRANFFKFYKKDLAKLLVEYNKMNLNSIKATARTVMDLAKSKAARHLKLSEAETSRLDSAEIFLSEMNEKPNMDQQFRALLRQASDPKRLNEMSITELAFLAQDFEQVNQILSRAAEIPGTLNKIETLREDFGYFSSELNRRVVQRSCVPMSWHELASGLPEAPTECN